MYLRDQGIVLFREQVFRRPEEKALAIVLGIMSLAFPLTILFNGSVTGFVSEWLSLSFLGFYFPIREAIERNRFGLPVVLGAILLVGLLVLFRNVANFQDVISGAEYAFEVARGRAVPIAPSPRWPALRRRIFRAQSRQRRRKPGIR